MSMKPAPTIHNPHKVTFSTYLRHSGRRTVYTEFFPMQVLLESAERLAEPGTQSVSAWLQDVTVHMQLNPTDGAYQCAVLMHEGVILAVMHAGFDASGAKQAWMKAGMIHTNLSPVSGSQKARAKLSEVIQSQAGLNAPTGPTMVISIESHANKVPMVLNGLEYFARQLFWALHRRHTTRAEEPPDSLSEMSI